MEPRDGKCKLGHASRCLVAHLDRRPGERARAPQKRKEKKRAGWRGPKEPCPLLFSFLALPTLTTDASSPFGSPLALMDAGDPPKYFPPMRSSTSSSSRGRISRTSRFSRALASSNSSRAPPRPPPRPSSNSLGSSSSPDSNSSSLGSSSLDSNSRGLLPAPLPSLPETFCPPRPLPRCR